MYQPPKKILERYADVLVNFALGKGRGIKKGDVVYVIAYENAKPFYVEILRAITKAGWAKLGFNDPPIHQDFISTAPRTVTAHLWNGKEKVIYRNGAFVI